MPGIHLRPVFGLAALLTAATLASPPLLAEGTVSFTVSGPEAGAVERDLRSASSLIAAERDGKTEAADIFAVGRAEYAPLVNTLYALGYYSPVIHVFIDGREAADILPLDAPERIGKVQVTVDPGPKFVFSKTVVAPLRPDTRLPESFTPGQTAASGLVREAAQAGVEGWRDAGHAKAKVADQNIVADHRAQTLSVEVALQPGPRLRFGRLIIEGEERMRERRIRKIAGLPEGRTYSPEDLRRSADRLRRSGVFRSVTLTEAEAIRSPDLLDITATVVEEKTRRYSIGAEVSSFEGLDLTGYWLHRNLLGGAERLRVEGQIGNIGARSSGLDYVLGLTLDRPATLTPDTTLSFSTKVAHLDEEDSTTNLGTFGVAFSHFFSERLTARVGLDYTHSRVTDAVGTYIYRNLSLPMGATWDSRDERLDAQRGFFLDGEIRPFLGFGNTDSGVRLKADGRTYVTFGDRRPVTFAARAQLGAIFGPDLLSAPREYLFYSGGGGTVRGQPYQSLGVEDAAIRGGRKIGGMAFAAASAEVRARITEKIGIVGFADIGYVSAIDFGDDTGNWHAGAGIGLRYATGFGPIRVDLAAPIDGSRDTGEGVQLYVGIGQAF